MTRALAAVILACSCVAGCMPQPQLGIASPEPALRLEAIREAVANRDHRAIPTLVTLLDSDDPATRLFAIRALEELTGDTLGYDYAAPERDRRAAAARWAERVRSEALPESHAARVENPGR